MKKIFRFLGLFIALCISLSTNAQTLLFDAAGSGNTFTKVDGTANYTLNLGGNPVTNGSVVMTAGAKAVGITLNPAISGYAGGGVTVVMLVSDVNVASGGQFISLRTSSTSGQGGIKLKSETSDGTVHATWQEAEWGSGALTAAKYPTDGQKHVVSYAYIRNGEDGGNGSAFYINKTALGNFGGLQSSTTISEIALGGISTATTDFLNAGMRIHRVQVYKGQLNAAQIAAANDNIKLPVVSNVLTVKIAEARGVISGSRIGNNPGEISQENLATLQAAIDAATQVLESSPSQEELTAAATVLHAAIQAFTDSLNKLKLSTQNNEVWYYINGVISYASGKSITMNNTNAGEDINFSPKSLNPAKLFKFEDAGNGKISIKNLATQKYIATNAKVSDEPQAFNLTYLGADGQYILFGDGANPLHGQDNGSLLVTWGDRTLNSGSAWRFEEVSINDIDKPVSINSVTARQGFTVTGIGNVDHPLMYATINVDGITGICIAKGIKLDFTESSNLTSIKNVKIYKIGNTAKRFKSYEAELIGQAAVENNAVEITFDEAQTIASGINQWAITVDISDDASEGHLVKATIDEIQLEGSTFAVNSTPEFPTQIFLTQALVIAPGDFGSASYRIPAIAVADDGSLIAVTDKRIGHSGDLPANIDLIVQRSTDNGKTWCDPDVIAGDENSLGSNGYGDPLIIKDKTNGKLIILCVAGPGFFGSTPENPNRIEYFESVDNGITWNGPRDITPMIYGAQCANSTAAAWKGAFPASGRMLQTRDGRIMSAMLVRNPVTNSNDNFVIYSDDSGETWHTSTSMAVKSGDEAKLALRNDGKVIISSRKGGGRIWNVSDDASGLVWTQTNQKQRADLPDVNCNGEIMTYTSTVDGFDKDRMLHSLCAGPGGRKNVSMTISYNEGENWQYMKSICPTASAYSTFDILPDGTIGMYYEDGTHGGTAYEMVYVRFSVDWLTDKTDTYVPPVPASVDGTKDNLVSVSVVNKKVVVKGTDETPRVFTTSGVQVNANASLPKGVYVVNVAGTSTKVVVK